MADEQKIGVATTMPRMGLNLSSDPMAIKEGEYTRLINGAIHGMSDRAPFIHIYRGNRYAGILPDNSQYLGEAAIGQRAVCLFSVDTATGRGYIGTFDGQHYELKVSSTDLGFNIRHQIQAVVDEDFNGHVNVIWVQEFAPIRIMDLNNPPMLNSVLDVDALVLFRKYNYPRLQISDITAQGRLLAGAYYLCLQYADANGNGLTSWSTPVGPVHIYRDSLSQPVAHINGSPSKEPTGKAIKILLSNLDPSFQYVNVGVIKSFEGIRTPVVAATIPSFQESYLYTGNPDTERDIDLKTILNPGVSYNSARTVAISDGTLLLGNLRGRKEYNLQPHISKIQMQWQLLKEGYRSETSYANPLNSVYQMQYRRNEVYAFGIVIRWNDGSKSRTYPLIGRQKDKYASGQPILKSQDEYGRTVPQGRWDSYTPPKNDDIYETRTSPQRWEVLNTAFRSGDDLGTASEGPSLYGEFGYWQSTDAYPNDPDVWGSNAGQPVRHFKMPDIAVAPIMDGKDEFRNDDAPVSIYKLGIRFVNIEEIISGLPSDVRDQMEGWELVRGDRKGNKSVIASGIIHNMLYQNWSDVSRDEFASIILGTPFDLTGKNDDVRLYQNYPHNDLRQDLNILRRTIGTEPTSPQLYNDRYRKDVFSFVSPDTSFEKTLLFGGELLIHKELYGVAKEEKFFLDPYPLLKDRGNNKDQVAYETLSVATYNNWKQVDHGLLRRQLLEAMYIPFNAQVAGGRVGIPIHNLTRESTVLLYAGKELRNPSVEDVTKAYAGDNDFKCRMISVYRAASLYYTSIVSRIPNQYGGVFDTRYIFTNFDNTQIKNRTLVFGGDSTIAPFSVKRQLVFYQNAQSFMSWEDGQEGVDLKTSETIKGSRYYYLSARKNANKDSSTECKQSGINLPVGPIIGVGGLGNVTIGGDMGFVPVIYTGVPVVYCESDFNINLRLNGQADEETFYPNLQDGGISLRKWTGIKHVDKDNYYGQNASYQEQNDLTAYQTPDPYFSPKLDSSTHYGTRVIHSLKGTPENRFNNLTVFLPLNYYDFQRDSGELWDIRDAGNHRLIFRLQHAIYEHQLYLTLTGKEGELQLGNGKAFEQEPRMLVRTDGGYAGTQAQWAYNNTPFGAFFVDPQRGSVLQYGQSLNDIAANDADTWFQDHLPLRLQRDIPGLISIDNPCNPDAVGYTSVWDHSAKMWLLTKIDYEVRNRDKLGYYSVDSEGKVLYNGGTVSLQDSSHFINRSFTIGYSPLTQKWVGWFSFIPRFYFQLNKQYYSSESGYDLWCHDSPVPRSYYGKRAPFVFEGVVAQKNGASNMTKTCSFVSRAFAIKNGVQQGESLQHTFNKGLLFNQYQSSGNLRFIVQDENDLSTLYRTALTGSDFIEVFLRKRGQNWNFALVYDLTKDHQQPMFIDDPVLPVLDNSNIDYARSHEELAYLNDLWMKYRLIYDLEEDTQIYLYLASAITEISRK